MRSKSVIISGTGSYLPSKEMTNDDISKIVDTNDEWIYTRSGIRARRIAESNEAASDMALHAAKKALKDANLTPDDIDLVIVTTVTPDMIFPSTACVLQAKLGIRNNIPCFDLSAACSGFVYALEVASKMMQSGHYEHALVVSSEKMSVITDWEDRTTCVLFGDGAGAVVLSVSEDENVGILDCVLGADGSDKVNLKVPAGGSVMPTSEDTVKNRMHFVKMDGRELFKHAVKIMEEKSSEILQRFNVSIEQVSLLIPHQANLRIIESVVKKLKLPMEKVYLNIDKYGNTSSASIPIALDEARKAGKIKKGEYILFVAFGAGLTWGATLVKWD